MTTGQFRTASLAALLLNAGCLFADHRSPEERKWDPPPEPLAFTFQGEIRDFATMRPEPAAHLEFWSDDPDYLPVATIHEDASYSVLVDRCRRRAEPCWPAPCESTADAIAHSIVGGMANAALDSRSVRCAPEIERFGLRARLGDRCSFAIEYRGPGWKERESTLWLHPCRAPERTLYPWRPLRPAPGQAAAVP